MENKKLDSDSLKRVVKNLDNYLWNITSNVICTICHDLFTQPVTTQCGHSFCSKCLNTFLYGENNPKNGCPLCRNSIKRRAANYNHVLAKVSKLCLDLSAAFKNDVMKLSLDNEDLSKELVDSSRIAQLGADNDKSSRIKRKRTNSKMKKNKVPDGISNSVIATLNDEGGSTKSEENIDLVSVSQTELKPDLYVSESPEIVKKLKRVRGIPSKQRVHDWLQNVHKNLSSVSDLKDNVNESPVGSSNASSMIRIDYNKSKKFDCVGSSKSGAEEKTEADPYEFISSQRSSGLKSRRKSTRGRRGNRRVPQFQAIHNFTKDSIKKNNEFKKIDDDVSSEVLQRTIKTYSRKSDKTITKSGKAEEASVSNYENMMSDSEESNRSSSKSESFPTARRRILPLGSENDSSCDVDVKKSKQESTIISEDSSDDSNNKMNNDKSSFVKTTDVPPKCSQSPGWSRVSNLKEDFEAADKRNRPCWKSLNISGGELSAGSSKNKSLGEVSLESEKETELLNNNNNNVYIEDLSQSSELLVGFDSVDSAEKEKDFKIMVEDMERDLETEIINYKVGKDCNMEANENSDCCKAEDVSHEKESNGFEIAKDYGNAEDISKEKDSNVSEVTKDYCKSEDVSNEIESNGLEIVKDCSDAEDISKEKRSSALEIAKNCENMDIGGEIISNVREVTEVSEIVKSQKVAPRQKNIPFALLGKIKKKRPSIFFLKLGRLSSSKRPRPAVVKLIFPKSLAKSNKKNLNVTAETQTDLSIADIMGTLNKTDVCCNTTQFEQVQKMSVEVQTDLPLATKEVQTSQGIEQKTVTIQTVDRNFESQVFEDFNTPREESSAKKPTQRGKSQSCKLSEFEDVYFDSELEYPLNETWATQACKLTDKENKPPRKGEGIETGEDDAEEIDLVSNDTDALMQKVIDNINLDLSRAKAASLSPKRPEPCEESDSDIFIEQTPPKYTQKARENNTSKSQVGNDKEDNVNAEESFLIISGCESKVPDCLKPEKEPSDKGKFSFPTKHSFMRGPNRKENDENNQNESNRRRDFKKEVICIASSGVLNRKNIEKFVNKFKIEHLSCPKKSMTHLVVGLHENDDEELVPYRTPKLLYAIANKKWVVTEAWVEACLKSNSIVAEESFESVDPEGGNGCSLARLSKDHLLGNCEVYLFGDYDKITKEEFSGLILDCGGTIVRSPTEFSCSNKKIRMILTDGSDGDLQTQGLMKKCRTLVLSRDVIIASIQSYKMVNFTRFLVHSISLEEMLEWGYPYDLVKNESEEDESDSE